MKNNNTPNPDQRAAMVKDAVDALTPSFRPDKTTDGELILTKAHEISKAAAAIVNPILADTNKLGVQHDKKALATIVGKAYIEGFSTFTRDELLYLLVFMHTDIAIEIITGETGNSKIITPI